MPDAPDRFEYPRIWDRPEEPILKRVEEYDGGAQLSVACTQLAVKPAEQRRIIHTIKGNAAMHGVSDLEQACHVLVGHFQ